MIHRLFVYGTLAPGRLNERVLADVPGAWEPATVIGTLVQEGWGAAVGYPGIVLGEHGSRVERFLFTSESLAEHWARLDEFEGGGYERVLTTVTLKDGTAVDAYLYRLREKTRSPAERAAAKRGDVANREPACDVPAACLPSPFNYVAVTLYHPSSHCSLALRTTTRRTRLHSIRITWQC